ncbi:MAG: metallophosphoesterase [Nitrospirae bacterium]|nr:metallophosphoesterase [Nitrospirota bacterium]
MTDDVKARYLVLSDMHFGTPESSINDMRFNSALIKYMVSRAPWEEIVLIGDLLDINLSTFTRSIEGTTGEGQDKLLFGFRTFIEALDSLMKQKEPPQGLKELAKNWYYVPGNHDYKIWDMLATTVVCTDVLSDGKPMGSVPTPLMKYKWIGMESFIAGIFRPYGVQDQVVVEYPNHEILFGKEQEMMVLTHGHYLDPTQTGFNNLSDHFRELASPADIKKAKRRVFIETAQYQTVANAVSFTIFWRSLVNVIVGPDAVGNKLKKLKNKCGDWLLRLIFSGEGIKGKQISSKQLLNIEYYLEKFCGYEKPPRWFVFGHTHHQDEGKTSRLGVDVYNAGSCYLDRGMAITFIEIETDMGENPSIQCMCVDQSGTVRKAIK